METAPTSIEVLLRPALGQSDEPSDLRGSLSPTSVYSTWQSQAVTHTIMNRARRCLTSVIEPITMSERRILIRLINVDITDVAKLWQGDSTTCCEVTKSVARLPVARLPCGEVTRILLLYVNWVIVKLPSTGDSNAPLY